MSAPQHRLLVVDDNEDNRYLLRRMLERRGYAVTLAEGGREALACLETQDFDLVLLDVMMPGMSGLEVLEELRRHQKKAELPVLMTTALTDSDDVVAALRAGANDYITKPIDFAVAFARIDGLLELRDALHAARERGPVVGLDGTVALGTVLDGRYRVESVLGEGGFAVVFEATQLSTGQVVALKLLRAHRLAVGGDIALERRRFEREMSLIGRLRHPNIVRLIDSGHVDIEAGGATRSTPLPRASEIPPTRPSLEPDPEQLSGTKVRIPYLVMEHLDGQPLSVLLAERAPLAIEEAVDLLLPVASAVGMAHRAGVVHRDLKPPNIMIVRGPGGTLEPKVLDFGIAKPHDDAEPGITRDASLVGTPEYMSPEQTRGVEVGTAADQYSVGVLLYEALTGQRPFTAPSLFELLQRIATGDYLPPSVHRPELPQGLEEVIARAMHVDPSGRFRSLEALFVALLPYASPAAAARWRGPLETFVTPSAPPPPMAKRDGEAPRLSNEPTLAFELPPPERRRRHPARYAGVAAIGLGALALLLLFAWGERRRDVEAPLVSPAHAVSALPGPGVPEAGRIRIAVEVVPRGAAIYLDGELMGHGRVDVSLTKGEGAHILRLSAPGFEPHERRVDESLGPVSIELKSLSR